MSFNVSAISDFTQKATDMLAASILFREDYASYDKAMGIPYKKSVKFISSNVNLQAGGCELTTSGGTSFTQKDLEAINFGTKVKYCTTDLLTKGLEDIDVIGKVIEQSTKDLANSLDTLFWMGNTGSSDLMQGLVTLWEADSNVIDSGFATGTTLIESNVDDAIKSIITATPAAVRAQGTLVIHVSYTTFNLYKNNLISASQYHLDMNSLENAKLEMLVYGYNDVKLRVETAAGFPDNQMYATYDDNIIRIYDEVENISALELKADPIDSKVFYLMSDFRFGVNYKFGAEVIKLN